MTEISIDATDLDGDLSDLLKLVPPHVRPLTWKLFDLWVVARDESLDVGELESASSTADGLEVQFERLTEVASKLLQVIDGVVVACDAYPVTRPDVDVRGHAAFAIQAVDSGSWRIFARNAGDLDAMRSGLPCYREIETDTPIGLE